MSSADSENAFAPPSGNMGPQLKAEIASPPIGITHDRAESIGETARAVAGGSASNCSRVDSEPVSAVDVAAFHSGVRPVNLALCLQDQLGFEIMEGQFKTCWVSMWIVETLDPRMQHRKLLLRARTNLIQ